VTKAPLDELALIRNAHLAEGIVYETGEVSGDDETGIFYEGGD
jgi:hypothetical protein